jgi:tRNA(Ile)-lysidine synthase
MNDALLDTISESLARDGAVAPGARLLVACSGGGDSVTLLHALVRLGHPVVVAHLDHGSRDASPEDAAWVRVQADALGLMCVVDRHAVLEEARALGRSFEAHARAVRYAFLVRTAREHDCAAIATGHSASDQAETVLLRVIRGTGPGGLGGVLPQGDHDGVRVVRPMIRLERDTIREWLVRQGITWREDPTNNEDIALRNRVRNHLLPLLRDEYNPSVDAALTRLADAARAEEAWLRGLAAEAAAGCVDDTGQINREPFRALPLALRRRVAMAWMEAQGMPPEFQHIEALCAFACDAATGAQLNLPGDVLLYAGRVAVARVKNDAPDEVETSLPVPGEAEAFGLRFTVRVAPPPSGGMAKYCHARRQWLNAELAGAGLTIRAWREGDRMTPLGAPGSRKLSDILMERGVPGPQRKHTPLVCRGDEILWVVGGPMAQCAAIDGGAAVAVEIEVSDATES